MYDEGDTSEPRTSNSWGLLLNLDLGGAHGEDPFSGARSMCVTE